jgi:hypothetical protein
MVMSRDRRIEAWGMGHEVEVEVKVEVEVEE